MTSIAISGQWASDISGKTAIVTGGASGIGLATARILALEGVKVYALDIATPDEADSNSNGNIAFSKCDVTSWVALREAFQRVGHVDMVFANAGISERNDYFTESLDENGNLEEPPSTLIDVNLTGVLYVIKLSWYAMKKQGSGGSIVITTSATAYVPWQSLAVYTSAKLALVGMVRSLRSLLILDDITINAVAPGATSTGLLPSHLAESVRAIGIPISTAHTVALALVHSATAKEPRRVEDYGKDKADDRERERRWNGRVIVTLGEQYTEVEEEYAKLRGSWLGETNTKLFRSQQAATDQRQLDIT